MLIVAPRRNEARRKIMETKPYAVENKTLLDLEFGRCCVIGSLLGSSRASRGSHIRHRLRGLGVLLDCVRCADLRRRVGVRVDGVCAQSIIHNL